jgi:hypothetical protein
VISEKQLLAEAGRDKKSTRREDRTDKQNDNTNTTAKAEEQKRADAQKRSWIHNDEARDCRQKPCTRSKESVIKGEKRSEKKRDKQIIR